MQKPLLFGYWSIRGRGQPIRFLLEYLKVPYQEKLYQYTENEKNHWFQQDKKTIGMDYPNLPYIIDGDFKIAQSFTIMQYLAERQNRLDLIGQNSKERAYIDQVQNVINDYRLIIRNLAFEKNHDLKKPEYLKTASVYMDNFNSVLGKYEWLCGNNITISDFYFYEMLLIYLGQFGQQEFDKYIHIAKYPAKFESIPIINHYLKTDKCKQYLTLFPEFVTWNGKNFIHQYNKKFA